MVLLECCPPFQWKPSLKAMPEGWRFMWGWLAVAYVPYDLNGYIEGLGRAGASLYRDGELQIEE